MLNLNLSQKDSWVMYDDNFLNDDESNNLFNYLNNLNDWESKEIIVFGKKCKQNRETINFSYNGLSYNYSGINNKGSILNEHKILVELINKIENLFNNKYSFNYILGNRYKSGSNNIGMHSDDERDLVGPIVSISLGCNRYFDIHGKYNNEKIRMDLKKGSLLIMGGNTQKNYKHGVPLQKKIHDTRINLTFRHVSK